MEEYKLKRYTDFDRYNYQEEQNEKKGNQLQNYFQKMQKFRDVEDKNQQINDKYQKERNGREINKLITKTNTEMGSTKYSKARILSNFEDNQEMLPQKKELAQSKSALILTKKQNNVDQQIYDQLTRFNVSPHKSHQNLSLPRIQNGNQVPTHKTSKSNFTTPKSYHDIQGNFQNAYQKQSQLQADYQKQRDRRIQMSEGQLNKIYQNQRDPRYLPYDQVYGYYPPFFNQNLYHKQKEDEEFKKKLINQNEKLMQMFEQMQRNHKEEISILKLREKHTLKMIKQQQEQIDLQNRKIEERDLPPPNFFLAPLHF
ncbi:hypothetical protein TTHERM_00463610 (macronuclear) [Tetrahymena thermophila SB210]|uniref:Uncharacterized protein n=1 Tax=Tetrahymena thermophila (strain SB210) TaxID=312017 RepID=Q23PS2_TETTS|nr:hypothetical protein TTHERM_00463610 [Tetrahymena thermophila SB210]EAR98613.1 hypothetical protein TTHERM_00463610 [Tetrahymena thermophila SB210]|eukprot:XP_001018858.1 hypothetical protein TTHERM_00463610 [Tetrahymena thermophila SB210]